MKRINRKLLISLSVMLLLLLIDGVAFYVANHRAPADGKKQTITKTTSTGMPTGRITFFASTDTMKASRDTQTRPLSPQEISDIVTVSASVNTNYITVDTHWDYPDYMQQWVAAIRATGRHVWFRSHPNQWEGNNGATGIMTPAQYEQAESGFILAHPALFQSGDIFDPCPEPEEGNYWYSQYGDGWTSDAPNPATEDYNAFIRDTTDVANGAFQQKGIQGVITTIRSTNSFFASHPDVYEQATVQKLGYITIDSYPEKSTTDPAMAVKMRMKELQTIENLRHLPIVIGEMGYSNTVNVDDITQQKVLKAEFQAMEPLSYIAGVNYWVGAGTETSGGYTHIFAKSSQGWLLRPAAYELALFFKSKLSQK